MTLVVTRCDLALGERWRLFCIRFTVAPTGRPKGGYNMWSLDEEGTLVSWTVVEARSQPEGSLADLGLAPGAALSLVRNALFRVPDFLPE